VDVRGRYAKYVGITVFPALLIAVSLLLAPPALAASADQAEYTRLSEEIERLAQKGAWSGVERSFQTCLELGLPLDHEDYVAGAHAARSRGDVEAARDRLRAAASLKENRAVIDWMWEIDTTYGQVALHTEPGAHELTPAVMPFEPDRAKAVAFARAELAESGSFTGLLPLGDYTFGDTGFQVEPRGPGIRLDMRDELEAARRSVKDEERQAKAAARAEKEAEQAAVAAAEDQEAQAVAEAEEVARRAAEEREEAERAEAARRVLEEQRAEMARRAAEEQRAEAAARAEEDAEAARRASEEERLAAARRAEEEERAEAARRAEEEERLAAARRAEEEERAEAARRAADEERAAAAQRAEEEQRAAAARRAEEEQRAAAARRAAEREEAERRADAVALADGEDVRSSTRTDGEVVRIDRGPADSRHVSVLVGAVTFFQFGGGVVVRPWIRDPILGLGGGVGVDPWTGVVTGSGSLRVYPVGPLYIDATFGPVAWDELEALEPRAYYGPSLGLGLELGRGMVSLDANLGLGVVVTGGQEGLIAPRGGLAASFNFGS